MKKLLTISAIIFFASKVSAQVEFNHSAGLTYLIGHYTFEGVVDGVSVSENSSIGYPGLTYNPRLDYLLNDNMSVSLSLYPTLCFSGSANYNSRSGGSSDSRFAFELPTLIQLNLGHHASRNADGDFGGFFGAGFNFGKYSGMGSLKGFTGMGGVKFYLKEKSIGIRAEFTKPIGLEDNFKATVFGLGILYNFGL